MYFNLCMDRSNFCGDRQLNSDPRLSVCSDSLPVNKQTSPKARLASTFALLPRSVPAMGKFNGVARMQNATAHCWQILNTVKLPWKYEDLNIHEIESSVHIGRALISHML